MTPYGKFKKVVRALPRYVKFVQGTPEAFEKLLHKDNDTLYVIFEEDEANATLYLGSKIVAKSDTDIKNNAIAISFLSELKDVQLSGIMLHDSVLVYDSDTQSWTDKNFNDLIFSGATHTSAGSSGLVPAPQSEEETKFLSGDGTWKAIELPEVKEYNASNIYFNTDLITNYDIGNVQLKNKDSVVIAAAGKSLVEVFGMLFGGEKTIEDDTIIAQPLDPYSYFTNYTDAEQAADEAATAGSLNTHYYYGQTLTVANNASARLYIIQPDASLAQVAVLQDIPTPIDTYSKVEIDNRIAAATHLKRKMINTVEEIGLYAENNADAQEYIYMVPTGLTLADNRYDEYMIISVIDEDGVEIQAIERVGTWEVDLSDYAKAFEITALTNKIAELENRIGALEAVIQGQT